MQTNTRSPDSSLGYPTSRTLLTLKQADTAIVTATRDTSLELNVKPAQRSRPC
ncbi:MAG: hypothetical protein RBJ76_09425 [Stenomitos frigidus ULC029]